MGEARIDGRPVALEAAIAEAARTLAASRLPVIAGLGTDIAGARAAVALARRIGGVVDHMHAAAVMRDLAVMRQAGAYLTTPNEARLRGDTLLLVGPGLIETWPDLPDRLFGEIRAAEAGAGERRIFWLCPGKGSANAAATTVGRNASELPTLLAMLRARVAGRPAGKIAEAGRRACNRAASRAFRRRGVVGGKPRCTDDRDAVRPDRRTERGHTLQRPAAGAGRQCAWRAAGVRLADRLSDAHRIRSPLSASTIPGGSTRPAWSTTARPIARSGSRPTGRRRPPGSGRYRRSCCRRRRRTSTSPSRSAAPRSTTTRSSTTWRAA